MTEFKVGDRVRRISEVGVGREVVGSLATIVAPGFYATDGARVLPDGASSHSWWFYKNMELAPPEKPEEAEVIYHSGDVVEWPNAQRESEFELNKLKAEFEQFKENVITIAQKYAKDHGMRDVVDDALKEMGLIKHRRMRVVLEFDDTYSTGPLSMANYLSRKDLDWFEGSVVSRGLIGE